MTNIYARTTCCTYYKNRSDINFLIVRIASPHQINLSLASAECARLRTPKNPLGATAQIGTRATANGVSLRKPSATMTFVVTSQLQFLGTLSLVEYTQDGLMKEFLSSFR